MEGVYEIQGLSVDHDGVLLVVLTDPAGDALQLEAIAGSAAWRRLLVLVKDAVYSNEPLSQATFDDLRESNGVTLKPYP